VSYVIRQGRRIEVEILSTSAKKKRGDAFAMVPLDWAIAATRATKTPQAMVWILLQHLAWKTKSNTFPLSNNGLRQAGVSREVKRRALMALEAAGLITVHRRGSRAPLVTLISQPR
jgi:hypothetical protein